MDMSVWAEGVRTRAPLEEGEGQAGRGGISRWGGCTAGLG